MKKKLTTLSFAISLLSCTLFGQAETFYYSSDFGILNSEEKAMYKRELKVRSAARTKVITYKLVEGEWTKYKQEVVTRLSNTELKIKRPGEKFFRETIFRSFHPAGENRWQFSDYSKETLVLEGFATRITPLHLQDTVKSYYKSSRPKSIAIYDQNRLLTNKNWLKNGNSYYDDLHYFVDEIPEHSMGQTHFRAYMINGIRESGIDLSQVSDVVVIGWVVMENGDVEGFHTLSGVFRQLNNIIIKLIQEMPGEWIPATVNGKKVRYYMTLPFNFINKSESFESLEFSTGFVVWD